MAAGITERISSVRDFSASIGFSHPSAEQTPHLGILKRKLPPENWTFLVIVAVDEARNLTKGKGLSRPMFLQDIRGASEHLPLTLVLAGLGNTRDVARECGLTRGVKVRGTGFLMAAFFILFGMDPTEHETRLRGLAAPAEGWPGHPHFAVRALARKAAEADGDLDRVDWMDPGPAPPA